MASKMLTTIKQRPLLVGGIAAASLLYLNGKRKVGNRLPKGEIWIDMDLSRPLSSAPPGVDLAFLTGEPSPLYVRDVVDALEMAAKDSKVKGVVGRFSYRSWGGGPLACVQEVRDAVKQFRDSGRAAAPAASTAVASSDTVNEGEEQELGTRKFTIAVADTFGEGGPAVGEYFLASAFEKVLIQKSGYVGLTGIGGQKLFFRGFLDKYGIKPEVLAREEYKSAADMIVNKTYSKHERESTTSLLTSIIGDVADAIAASRGFSGRKDVLSIMQDCPLPAQLALSANLIDGIMYQHDVDRIVKEGFKADDEGPEDGVLSTFADGEGEKCTRVSIRDYIKNMREKREAKSMRHMLPHMRKGEADAAPKTVALINVNGAITRSDGSRSGEGATSRMLCKRLQEAADDSTVAAVVLRVDSPGGSAIASDSIAAAVHRVRTAGKPVVCSMGDVAASGGYMIAAACDKIVAQPTTITGSIGVIAAKLSIERLLKDWGITVASIEISENHLAFSPFKEFTPKQRRLMDKRVGEIYEDFVADVASGRKLSVEEVLKVAKGRVWTGRQALDRGLVDELGGLNNAITIAKTAAGLPEDAPVVGAKRLSLREMARKMMTNDSSSDPAEGERSDGLRGVVLALADSIAGAEAVETLLSAVSLLASANDLVNGKVPRGRAPQAELELPTEHVYDT